jgi:hypothetical protein
MDHNERLNITDDRDLYASLHDTRSIRYLIHLEKV